MPPLVGVAVKATEMPEQIAPVGFGLMITDGVTEGVIVTDVDSLSVHPLSSLAVTVYDPVAAVVTLAIDGFCWFELNPLGPVQK